MSRDALGNIAGGRAPQFLWRVTRRYAWVIAMALAVLLISLLVPYALNSPGENEIILHAKEGSFEVTPVQIYSSGSSSSYVSSNIIGVLNGSFNGTVTLCRGYFPTCASSPGKAYAQEQVEGAAYFSLYVHSTQLQPGENQVVVYLNATPVVSFQLSLSPTPTLPLYTLAALLIAGLYTGGVYLAPIRPRWAVALALPFYGVVAALFGHRYDLYFMISSGIRLVDGVNPYLASASVPGYLKWIYPPPFSGYSAVVAVLFGALTGRGVPANGSLNYPGAVVGYPYNAWTVLSTSNLPVYYLLIKLPMLVATVATYFVLKGRFGLKRAEKLWLLNPFIILVGVAWGQLDIIAALTVALSIYSFSKGDTFSASLFASVGAAVKIFPALLLPFILISSRHRLKDSLPVVGAAAVVLLFYAYVGSVTSDLSTLFFTGATPYVAGSFYANGLTWQALVPLPNFPSLFVYIFLPFYAYQVVRFVWYRRDPTQIMLENLLIFYLTYSMANTQYFVYAVLLFLIAEDIRSALVFSAIPAVYQLMANPAAYFLNPLFSYNYAASPLGQSIQLQDTFLTYTHLNVALILAATAIYAYAFLRTEAAHGIAKDFRCLVRVS